MGTPPKPSPSVRSLSCPNCGGTIQLRGLGRSLSAVCIQCLSILDTTTPSLQVLQKFQASQRYQPLIPLGTRGKLRGELYEVIGFQVREMRVEGTSYFWSEYVLFNPYKGFRYLTEYNGHWNDVTTLRVLPNSGMAINNRPTATHLGQTYGHFQNYRASTVYVMGEFPWTVKVGESAVCDDFIAPPRMLSRESTDGEVTWSLSEYTTGKEIWQSFQLKGSPPNANGIFANQPSPTAGAPAKAWGNFAFWILVLLVVQLFWTVAHQNKKVFSQRYSFTQQTTGGTENSFVTDTFELKGRTANVQVELQTDLDNNRAFFNLALINADNGKAYEFSRQVSYYRGSDSDGSWSEGKARDSVVLPSIPPGRYYLRVEPEMDTSTAQVRANAVRYQIQITHDVTTWAYFFIACLLMLIPPIWTTLRSGSFETRRWAESDYGASTTSTASGDDD